MSAADLVSVVEPPAPLALGRIALFLDLDGTLAPIAPRPDAVGYEPRRSRLLERLIGALDGRLAIVSGRSLADIDRILADVHPVVSAVHGLVIRTAEGVATSTVDPRQLDRARQVLGAFAARDPGLLVEDKEISLALHYRLAPACEPEAVRLVEGLAAELGWEFQPGRAVAELRPPGPDKGDSVRRLMATAPFAGAVPVFVGDDITDEDGFRAAAELGGFGVVVGARRDTLASYRLKDVAAVLDWLERPLS
ncbi:MAG: trehalose-phosphatase [Caulobacteraceae bacterium]|nr:trehalose-phosphatase [Caulobacteraceae bacterium]